MTKKNKNNDPGWCNLSLARDHVSRIMITRLPVYQHKEREEEAELDRERERERAVSYTHLTLPTRSTV